MATNSNDSSNIFNVVQFDEAYWDGYLAARPKYHLSDFYDRLFTYHNAHSGQYGTAHDVGTGPGQVAGVLASRFQHVIASDANEMHLNVCKHRNANNSSAVSTISSPGEQLAANVQPSSADAIFSGEALALMDAGAAIDGFAKILKPGGTVAIWYYGRPTFADGDNELCQSIYNKIVNKLFGSIIKGGGPMRAAQWKRTTDVMASCFDSVRFPEKAWKDIERHKWNTHGKMTFYDQEACDFRIDVSSEIGENDKIIEITDETFWAEQWDINQVKRFVDVNLPSFQDDLGRDPEVEKWYEELADAMGGENVKRAILWPVVLLLATRR